VASLLYEVEVRHRQDTGLNFTLQGFTYVKSKGFLVTLIRVVLVHTRNFATLPYYL
jgi:hypothetical protein